MPLLQDMAELESAVADNLLPVDAIGAPHRVLRAFRPLIFLSTPEVATSLLVSAVPPSMVLHHMYSRAPEALQSPHARSGFTPAQVHHLRDLPLPAEKPSWAVVATHEKVILHCMEWRLQRAQCSTSYEGHGSHFDLCSGQSRRSLCFVPLSSEQQLYHDHGTDAAACQLAVLNVVGSAQHGRGSQIHSLSPGGMCVCCREGAWFQ